MNWLIISLDISFTLIAGFLCILGFRTYKSIEHLGMGKNFWVPIFLSGILFVIASTGKIFGAFVLEYGLVMTFIDLVVRVSSLLAIGVLFVSIYSYSRIVKTVIKVTKREVQKEIELTSLEKQTNNLLKQVEKLKNQIKSNE